MSNPIRIVLLSLLAVASVGIGLWFGNQAKDPEDTGYDHIGGEFTLESANGPVSLSDYRGKVVALYFGYTHCPDICPTSLAALSQALDQLPEDKQTEVQGLFISVDPERDSPQVAAQYAQSFHPRFTGLSGDTAAITEVAKRFFVLFEKVELEDSAMDYAVDHSSILYILGKDGKVKELVRHSQSQDDLVKALQAALSA